ncbi:MAG: restriction endonuclease [Candidatus Zixiibacteriota bacterium]
MNNIWVVRANFGMYADHFVNGGYVAIGWMENVDLSIFNSRDELYTPYAECHPDSKSNVVIGQQVGQIARFLFEIQFGDYVITPSANTEYINYGIIRQDGYYYERSTDGCPYFHRRKVKWHSEPIQRSQFSVPFQNTIRSSLTVFCVSHRKNFFETIGRKDLVPQSELKKHYDYYDTVLNHILELDATEFEVLITHILTAMGFEAEHVGKVGDSGVDAKGELDIANMAKVRLFVQAKRYKLGSRINASTVQSLRQIIPAGAQGTFITTSDFQNKALEVAVEPGFPRIGTINGKQLVDILSDVWEDIPGEFRDKLGLKRGLVLE